MSDKNDEADELIERLRRLPPSPPMGEAERQEMRHLIMETPQRHPSPHLPGGWIVAVGVLALGVLVLILIVFLPH